MEAAIELVAVNVECFKFLGDLSADSRIQEAAIDQAPSLLSSQKGVQWSVGALALALLKDGNLLRDASPEVTSNRELLELSMQRKPHALQFAHVDLRGDVELILKACDVDPTVLYDDFVNANVRERVQRMLGARRRAQQQQQPLSDGARTALEAWSRALHDPRERQAPRWAQLEHWLGSARAALESLPSKDSLQEVASYAMRQHRPDTMTVFYIVLFAVMILMVISWIRFPFPDTCVSVRWRGWLARLSGKKECKPPSFVEKVALFVLSLNSVPWR